MVSLNKALLNPYFWAGYVRGGGRLTSHEISMGFSGTPNNGTPENGKRDPYYSHIFRDSYGSGMGIVWVPLTIRGSHYWGVPENPIDNSTFNPIEDIYSRARLFFINKPRWWLNQPM